MDEFAIPNINADMTESASQGVEKHQITGVLAEEAAVRQRLDTGRGARVRLAIGLVRPFNVLKELSIQEWLAGYEHDIMALTARGPLLWNSCDALMGNGVKGQPDWATDWDGSAQPAPDYEVNQRVNW